MSPQKPNFRFADIAVTYTADEFHGIYRGKKQHDEDFDDVLDRAKAFGCQKVMLTTMTLEGARQNMEVCRRWPNTCYMTLGVHPYHAGDLYDRTSPVQNLVDLGRSLLADDSLKSALVAFGEIGLDYFYLNRASKELQQKAFLDQLEVATGFDLPLFLHVRDSYQDFVSLIKPFLPRLKRGGIVHSFAGTKDEMLGLVELGFHISVNGISFRTEEQVEMVRAIPLDRLQLETDAPWCFIPTTGLTKDLSKAASPLPPSKKADKFERGKMVKGRNESCVMEHIARIVAGIKAISVDEVADAAWRNSQSMFKLEDVAC